MSIVGVYYETTATERPHAERHSQVKRPTQAFLNSFISRHQPRVISRAMHVQNRAAHVHVWLSLAELRVYARASRKSDSFRFDSWNCKKIRLTRVSSFSKLIFPIFVFIFVRNKTNLGHILAVSSL